jgi:hypothetical protein
MSQPVKTALRTMGKLGAVALLAVGTGAWDDEENNRVEFVTRGAGDAVAVNQATQTIDPWPPYVKNRKLTLSGDRAHLAMQRYGVNRVLQPRPLNPVKAPELIAPDAPLQAPVPQQ